MKASHALLQTMPPSTPLRLLVHACEKRPVRIATPYISRDPLSAAARAYLKALRHAEMAVWDRPNQGRPPGPPPGRTKGSLPDSKANPSGSWVLWVWVACLGLTLFQNLVSSPDLFAKWKHFTAMVSQFLG